MLIIRPNNSPQNIALNALLAFVSLFVNGFGVYLTIHAAIGAGPIMQFAFRTLHFSATGIHHQSLGESAKVLAKH